MRLLVTGGCGFIGSAVVRRALALGHSVVNVDKLTYAASPDTLCGADLGEGYVIVHADICDRAAMDAVFSNHRPDAVMNLAAESHVDRSIDGPAAFIETNIIGTYTLLESAFAYWTGLDAGRRAAFRFHHVSTDEVFGSLDSEGRFNEETAYRPRSPYAASKAASDHLVGSWGVTYGLPIIITNSSNTYGPFQFPEKLMPVVILNALTGKPIPIYGRGENVRDWLYVEDHAEALLLALHEGRVGETYAIGGNAEARNIDIVRALCTLMDQRRPQGAPHERLISFAADRPGHDFRYAIDATKIGSELGWSASRALADGLAETVDWYLENEAWWRPLLGRHDIGERLGIKRLSDH